VIRAKNILIPVVIFALFQITVFGYRIGHKHKDSGSHTHVHTYIAGHEFTQCDDDGGVGKSTKDLFEEEYEHGASDHSDVPDKKSDENTSERSQHNHHHLQYSSYFEIQNFIYIRNLFSPFRCNFHLREDLYSSEFTDSLYRPPRILS
jgi:hypothetical protein